MGIPKNLIVFFHDFDLLPEPSSKALEITCQTNPDFRVIRLDDKTTLDLIETTLPPVADIFRRIRVPAARCDIARLVALYEYGGIYIDISLAFSTPFEELFDFSEDNVLLKHDNDPVYKGREEIARVTNRIILAAPKTEFIRKCIAKSVFNLRNGIYNYHVNVSTGPDILTDLYRSGKTTGTFGIAQWSDLINQHVTPMRARGVNNQWVAQQTEGIIDPGYYTKEPLYETEWKRMFAGAAHRAIHTENEPPLARFKRRLAKLTGQS